MQKRPTLIATAAAVILGLTVGLYPHRLPGAWSVLSPTATTSAWDFYSLLGPVYAALSRHTAVVMLGDSLRKRSQLLQNYSAVVDRLSANGSTVIVQSTLATSQNYASLNASVIDANRSFAEADEQAVVYTST
jgi:hypothetical protein